MLTCCDSSPLTSPSPCVLSREEGTKPTLRFNFLPNFSHIIKKRQDLGISVPLSTIHNFLSFIYILILKCEKRAVTVLLSKFYAEIRFVAGSMKKVFIVKVLTSGRRSHMHILYSLWCFWRVREATFSLILYSHIPFWIPLADGVSSWASSWFGVWHWEAELPNALQWFAVWTV